VVDDGVGVDESAEGEEAPAFGLMRERLALVGGECEVCNTAGQGTRVSVRLPFGAAIIEQPRLSKTA